MSAREVVVATLVASAAAMGCAGLSRAATITYTTSVPLTQTAFTTSVSVARFDPMLGMLSALTIQLDASVFGSIGVENIAATSTLIAYSLEAAIVLERPDHGDLAEVLARSPLFDRLDQFDGEIDFDGTSGAFHADLTGSGSAVQRAFPLSDFALFTGTDPIVLPVVGVNDVPDTSGYKFTGTSNASVDITVTYTYSPVAEPAYVGMVGITGIIALRHLTRSRMRRGHRWR